METTEATAAGTFTEATPVSEMPSALLPDEQLGAMPQEKPEWPQRFIDEFVTHVKDLWEYSDRTWRKNRYHVQQLAPEVRRIKDKRDALTPEENQILQSFVSNALLATEAEMKLQEMEKAYLIISSAYSSSQIDLSNEFVAPLWERFVASKQARWMQEYKALARLWE